MTKPQETPGKSEARDDKRQTNGLGGAFQKISALQGLEQPDPRFRKGARHRSQGLDRCRGQSQGQHDWMQANAAMWLSLKNALMIKEN